MKLEDLGLSPAPWHVSRSSRSRVKGARPPMLKVRDSGMVTICELHERVGRFPGQSHDAANFRAMSELPELLEFWFRLQGLPWDGPKSASLRNLDRGILSYFSSELELPRSPASSQPDSRLG